MYREAEPITMAGWGAAMGGGIFIPDVSVNTRREGAIMRWAYLILIVLLTGPAAGQAPTDSASVLVIRRTVLERLVHEGRPLHLVAPDSAMDVVELTPPADRVRGFWRATLGSLEATLRVDSTGPARIISTTARVHYSPVSPFSDALQSTVRSLQGPTHVQRLPSSRLIPLWLSLPAVPLRAGVSWADTLRVVEEPMDGVREFTTSYRQHRITGDTLIDGRRHVRIRTTADVVFEQSDLLEQVLRVRRSLSGTTSGTAWVDPESGLRRAAADTMSWTGEAILHDDVAGPLTSRVRYDAVAFWTPLDLRKYGALRDSLRAVAQRRSTGMLSLPRTPLEERLAAGDSAVRDSLIARWQQTRDAAEARQIQMLFARTPRFDSLLVAVSLARADTATALMAARRMPGHGSLQTERLLFDMMNDPPRMWRLGAAARYEYEQLAENLMRSTPLVPVDPANWRCRPDLCDFWLGSYHEATDPRLRDAILVGLFAHAPARWIDDVRAREAAGSRLVANVLRLARGVPAEQGWPMPGEGADWREWHRWWQQPSRLSDQRYALAFRNALSQGEPVAELRALWETAEDSARAVLTEILRSVNAVEPVNADELAVDVRSGNSARVDRALAEVSRRLFREGTLASDEVQVELRGALADSIFRGGTRSAPWPPRESLPDIRLPSAGSSLHGLRADSVFVLTDSVPAMVLERLPDGVIRISGDDWKKRDLRNGGHLWKLSPVRQWGPFVMVRWDWTAFERRGPEEAPRGYAGGGHFIMMRTGNGWRILTGGSWIT